MNEVEKMYRNAHVYPRVYGDITKETFENKVFNMADMCNEAFTAEKQIAILEFCLKWGQVHILQGIDDEYRIENSYYRKGYQPTLADAIANYINEKWEKLTPEERKQIKEILSE